MGAKIIATPNSIGSGEGWHRDRCDKRQTKFILYLCEVNENNGPFQYIKNSSSVLSMLNDFFKYRINPTNSRITDKQINHISSKEPDRLLTFTAKAGTLLIANTRGIHRGKPLSPDCHRYSLTNYYWLDTPVPEHIKELSKQPKNIWPSSKK